MADTRYKLKIPAHLNHSQRQSPITDIHTLTVLVLESYEQTFTCSSPKLHERYEKLLRNVKARR